MGAFFFFQNPGSKRRSRLWVERLREKPILKGTGFTGREKLSLVSGHDLSRAVNDREYVRL
jgi:hypothetical protein